MPRGEYALPVHIQVDRPLIRQVVVPGSGYRVGLLPYTSKGKIAGLAVTLRGPGVDYFAAGPWSGRPIIPPGLSALQTRAVALDLQCPKA